MHALKGAPHVIDLRNIGLVGAIELAPRDGAPGARAYDVFLRCFEDGLLVRQTGDVLALAPPLTIEKAEIDRIFETLVKALKAVA
jgi:beta-alanine--pyruvate transaminase